MLCRSKLKNRLFGGIESCRKSILELTSVYMMLLSFFSGKAGIMDDGLVKPMEEGTPQGDSLSPLLSNIMLDDFDRKLTDRMG